MNSIAVALENAKLVALTSSRRVRGVLARSRRPCYGSEKHLHRYLASSSIFATQTALRLASAIQNARALLSAARRKLRGVVEPRSGQANRCAPAAAPRYPRPKVP